MPKNVVVSRVVLVQPSDSTNGRKTRVSSSLLDCTMYSYFHHRNVFWTARLFNDCLIRGFSSNNMLLMDYDTDIGPNQWYKSRKPTRSLARKLISKNLTQTRKGVTDGMSATPTNWFSSGVISDPWYPQNNRVVFSSENDCGDEKQLATRIIEVFPGWFL